jgi:dihydropteroate synthase
MAILNATPDSFFDGGRHHGLDAARSRAWAAVEEGASVLDVGGESTRPGAVEVPPDEELRRVLPVLESLAREGYPLPISVDTTRARVAREALAAGAVIVNDVSGGTREPAILAAAAEAGAAVVLMHMRGSPRTMQRDVHYDDLIDDVIGHLRACGDAASAAGVPLESQAVDPGVGFGKSAAGCLALVARLEELQVLQRPILLGASRKSFLAGAFGHEGEDRVIGSVVAAAIGAQGGASIVRAHDVRATRLALDVAQGLAEARA